MNSFDKIIDRLYEDFENTGSTDQWVSFIFTLHSGYLNWINELVEVESLEQLKSAYLEWSRHIQGVYEDLIVSLLKKPELEHALNVAVHKYVDVADGVKFIEQLCEMTLEEIAVSVESRLQKLSDGISLANAIEDPEEKITYEVLWLKDKVQAILISFLATNFIDSNVGAESSVGFEPGKTFTSLFDKFKELVIN